ncbi:MAG: hypothetical protein ACK559_09280, partial [bacterium]
MAHRLGGGGLAVADLGKLGQKRGPPRVAPDFPAQVCAGAAQRRIGQRLVIRALVEPGDRGLDLGHAPVPVRTARLLGQA